MTKNIFNPLALRTPENVEHITNLVLQIADVNIDDAEKEELKVLILSLPEDASMAFLIKEIKRKEAEKLGLSEENLEILSTLFADLQSTKSKRNIYT